MNLHFDLPKEQSSIIKVIGVGGGGGNAVNHMHKLGIRGVNYVICNTDQQALELSPVPNKIQLGPEMTRGLGAGSKPEIGESATQESAKEIQEILSKNTRMVFITAGMGGGTGTGGAPVVAKLAKDMGILTVGIVTTPFSFEGRRKLRQANEGIEKLKKVVDSLIIISNDKIREIFGNLTKSEAFSRADDVLTMAAKSISEIITVPGEINVDFADVQYVMQNSGVAIMGEAQAEGEDRAMRAVHTAINSPLLNNNDITGASNILINISSGAAQVTIDEITEINDFVQDAAGNDTDIIFGTCDDDALGDKISVTIIATGFEKKVEAPQIDTKKVIDLSTPNKQDNTTETPTASTEESITLKDVSEQTEQENKPDLKKKDVPADTSIVFDMTNNADKEPETPSEDEPSKTEDESCDFVIKEVKKDDNPQYNFYVSPSKSKPEVKESESEIRHRERIEKLKRVSFRWQNLEQLENTPAYMRKGVKLNHENRSDKEITSKFTIENININDDKRPEFNKDNGYLNDNID